jgi:hypothetical protein
LFSRATGGADLAFHAALAEAAGHQDGVVLGQLGRVGVGDGFRVDVLDLHAHMVLHAGVAQRLVDRLVASDRSTYLPTMAIVTSPCGCSVS